MIKDLTSAASGILFLALILLHFKTYSQEATNSFEPPVEFIHAKETQLVQNNKEVLLKGVGLGGWMLQEGYMLGTNGAQHQIREKLEDLAGKQATD